MNNFSRTNHSVILCTALCALFACLTPDLFAQGKGKVLRLPPPAKPNQGEDARRALEGEHVPVDLISFSLPVKAAMSLLHGKEKVATDDALFQKCMDLSIRKRVVANAQIRVGAVSRQRALGKSVSAYIYPTEYDRFDERGRAIPMGLDTREVGTILELEGGRSKTTNQYRLNVAYEHHPALPLERHLEIVWKGRKKADKHVQILTDFYAERIQSNVAFERPEAILWGITRPPARGSSTPSSGKEIHLVFLRPAFNPLPIKEDVAVPNHRAFKAVKRSRRNVRVSALVVELPAAAAENLSKEFGGVAFAAAVEGIQEGSARLVTMAELVSVPALKAKVDAVREWANPKEVAYNIKTKKTGGSNFRTDNLGTAMEFIVEPWKDLSAPLKITLSLDYQVDEPRQIPISPDDAQKMKVGKFPLKLPPQLKNAPIADGLSTIPIKHDIPRVEIVGQFNLQSGAPTLVKMIDPATISQRDDRKPPVRHLIFIRAAILDLPAAELK